MPIFNRHFFDQEKGIYSPAFLANVGPILDVEVNVPQALMDLSTTQNIPVPSPITGWALIDTGASRTCVDQAVLSSLMIKPISTVTMFSANGQAIHEICPTKLYFPSLKLSIDFGSVISVNLEGQDILDKPLIVLVGRDILSNTLFFYNGSSGLFVFAF